TTGASCWRRTGPTWDAFNGACISAAASRRGCLRIRNSEYSTGSFTSTGITRNTRPPGCDSACAARTRKGTSMSTDLAQLEARIRRLEDIEEIRGLRMHYHYCVNEGKFETVADIFSED